MDPLNSVCFRINKAIVSLHLPDEETCNKLRDNHTLAITNIRKLVDNGKIALSDPITFIALIENGMEKIIYNAAVSHSTNSENIQPNVVVTAETPSAKESSELFLTESSDKSTGDGWGDVHTRFMLDKYYAYMDRIGPMQTFKTKRDVWNRISTDFFEKFKTLKTGRQIEDRYKTVMRRKKDAVINNSKSGHSRQTVPYEAELKKIADADDSVELELIRSAKKLKVLERRQQLPLESESNSEEEDESEDNKRRWKKLELKKFATEKQPKRKGNATIDSLRMLHASKGEAKEQRHNEKLQLIRELFTKKEN